MLSAAPPRCMTEKQPQKNVEEKAAVATKVSDGEQGRKLAQQINTDGISRQRRENNWLRKRR